MLSVYISATHLSGTKSPAVYSLQNIVNKETGIVKEISRYQPMESSLIYIKTASHPIHIFITVDTV